MNAIKWLAGSVVSLAIAFAGISASSAAPSLVSDDAAPVAPASSADKTGSAAGLAPSPVGVARNGKKLKTPVISSSAGTGTYSSPAYQPPRTPVAGMQSIFGADDRYRITNTTSYPNRAIVYITRKGRPHCSGWMVSKDTVVTAGHCVYDVDTKKWEFDLQFYPGANGSSRPYGSAGVSKLWTDVSYINSGDPLYDWGIVKLNKPLGNATGWFGMKTQPDSYDGTRVTLRGYPGEKPGQMWSMSGPITRSKEYQLCYTIDTTQGQSGSPVYLASTNQVIAIHAKNSHLSFFGSCTTLRNGGTRISPGLYEIISKYK